MAWNKTVPVSTTLIVDIPGIFQGNQEEIDDIWEQEHYNLSNTLSGRHIPGKCRIMEINNLATLTSGATSADLVGAIALNTTHGSWMVSTEASAGSSVWSAVHLQTRPIVIAYIGGTGDSTSSLPASAAATPHPLGLKYGSETVDMMSKYADGIFTTPASGYYLIDASLRLSASTRDVGLELGIRHYDRGTTSATSAILATDTVYEKSPSTNQFTMHVSTLASAYSGDRFQVVFSHDCASSGTVTVAPISGSTASVLSIRRIS